MMMFKDEYAFLSNMQPCVVEFEGVPYSCVESAYVAAKTLDIEERDLVSRMNGYQAKKFGKTITLREDWEEIKVGVMFDLVTQKFTRNQELARMLVSTGDVELIEGNTRGDLFWGVDIRTKEGKNMLGNILTIVREGVKEACEEHGTESGSEEEESNSVIEEDQSS